MTSVTITDKIHRVLELARTCPGIMQTEQHVAPAPGRPLPGERLAPQFTLIECVKCPELVARNAKYEDVLDNRSYDVMVADVTIKEREAEALRDSILPTARLQNGFGLKILVTKGTFFLLAYLGSKHFLGADELWAGLFGCLALTFGMLMEVMLYIIRTSRP